MVSTAGEVALRGQSRHLPVTAEVWKAAKEQGPVSLRGRGAGPGRLGETMPLALQLISADSDHFSFFFTILEMQIQAD